MATTGVTWKAAGQGLLFKVVDGVVDQSQKFTSAQVSSMIKGSKVEYPAKAAPKAEVPAVEEGEDPGLALMIKAMQIVKELRKDNEQLHAMVQELILKVAKLEGEPALDKGEPVPNSSARNSQLAQARAAIESMEALG